MKLFGGKPGGDGNGRPAIDFLVACLGNYGKKYANNRHNAGFMTADRLCERLDLDKGKMRMAGELFNAVTDGKRIIIAKPQTYMNRSGECVARVAKYYNIPPEHILVIYDDMELPCGHLRIRAKGTDGGHNGMKSIINFMGSYAIPRIRIGIGRPPDMGEDYDVAKWVLGDFRSSERKLIGPALDDAASAALTIISGGLDEAMNRYNGAPEGRE